MATATVSGPYASASLYVGDLAQDVTEALLYEIFNAVGPVTSIRVCRDAATRRSLGYAYVNFARADDADRALDTLNFKAIKSRPCRIMWCNRDPSLRRSGVGNVFVNGLAKSIDNKQLYDTFSVFGNILSCKVSTSPKAESLGYGFVHFETEESATNAIERVNGKVILDQTVTVAHFKSKRERGANKNVFTNVFVKNFPSTITQEAMLEMFSKYGVVTSSVLNVDADKNRAFGFINFATSEQASAAVDGLNNTDLGNDRKLYVNRAQKKEERERELRERFERIRAERNKKYENVNLYIKNLTEDVDDQKLREMFTTYGSITSAKVMRDKANASRGFGFVCFSTPDEAAKAMSEMNSKMLGGKPLYVALHQNKEYRQRMLEQQFHARVQYGSKYNMAPMPMQYAGQHPGPMMFQKFPQGPAPMMYPGAPLMSAPRRWNHPQMMPRPVNYQLMPVNATRPGPQPMGGMMHNQQRNNRGPRRNNLPPKVNGQEQGIKYVDNVRNRQQPVTQPVTQPATQTEQPAVLSSITEPLTIKALAAAPEELQKQMIGERLFPLVQHQQPALAGKITGMLLEMDNGELIHLLESQQALTEKIQEALEVLQDHGVEGDDDTEETKQ